MHDAGKISIATLGIMVMALAIGGPAFLSGYCLHRVKCSRRKGTDRHMYYGLSYLAFLLPTLPWLFLGLEAGETKVTCWYFAGVTAALFAMLPFSPPNKRFLMYIPGVFAILYFCCLASLVL